MSRHPAIHHSMVPKQTHGFIWTWICCHSLWSDTIDLNFEIPVSLFHNLSDPNMSGISLSCSNSQHRAFRAVQWWHCGPGVPKDQYQKLEKQPYNYTVKRFFHSKVLQPSRLQKSLQLYWFVSKRFARGLTCSNDPIPAVELWFPQAKQWLSHYRNKKKHTFIDAIWALRVWAGNRLVKHVSDASLIVFEKPATFNATNSSQHKATNRQPWSIFFARFIAWTTLLSSSWFVSHSHRPQKHNITEITPHKVRLLCRYVFIWNVWNLDVFQV